MTAKKYWTIYCIVVVIMISILGAVLFLATEYQQELLEITMNQLYKKSGVDIELAGKFISDNIHEIQSTYDDNVLISKNNFCGMYDISRFKWMDRPILVSSTDGVGSKSQLALHYKYHYNIGQDVVFNNTNDIICSGAIPLVFLDYIGTGKLDPKICSTILYGIVDACKEVNISLVGGETAELPLIYRQNDIDLVGTCVGVVDKKDVYDPSEIEAGDYLIGLKSSGPHSNGYSLINKIVEQNFTPDFVIADLLLPTTSYLDIVTRLKDQVDVKGVANITGGGIIDNVPRMLPEHLTAFIDQSKIRVPDVFKWIQLKGKVSDEEMWKVFNMGIGMVVCVSEEEVPVALEVLEDAGHVIGQVVKKINGSKVIFK